MTENDLFPCPICASDAIYCAAANWAYGCRNCAHRWGHPQAIAESGQTASELLHDWKQPNN